MDCIFIVALQSREDEIVKVEKCERFLYLKLKETKERFELKGLVVWLFPFYGNVPYFYINNKKE